MDETGSTKKAIRPSRLDPFREVLGTKPDVEIAQLAGCTVANVYGYRRRHNIPLIVAQTDAAEDTPEAPPAAADSAADSADAPPAIRRARTSRLDRYRHLVGRLADADVARIAGCTPANVSIYRRKHDIPINHSPIEPAAEAPPAAVPHEIAKEAAPQLYTVDFEDGDGIARRVVAAADLASALLRVLQLDAQGRRVYAVRFVGELL